MSGTLRVSAFTGNYGVFKVANAITNEMHDLSACTKFPDAHFQPPLLIIMSKLVAEIQSVYQKMDSKIGRKASKKKERAKGKHMVKTKD